MSIKYFYSHEQQLLQDLPYRKTCKNSKTISISLTFPVPNWRPDDEFPRSTLKIQRDRHRKNHSQNKCTKNERTGKQNYTTGTWIINCSATAIKDYTTNVKLCN